MSSEWMTAYRKYRKLYDKPEARKSRSKALSNGQPKDIRIYSLTNACKLSKESMQSLEIRLEEIALSSSDKFNTEEDKEFRLVYQKIKKVSDDLESYKKELGAMVAEAILNKENIAGDIEKTAKMFDLTSWSDPFELPRPKQENIHKITLKTRMLAALDALNKQWFPNGEAFQMVTKAALQKASIGDQLKRRYEGIEAGEPENLRGEFRDYLKELGLSNLPERRPSKQGRG
jgi:hypothetical protein